MKGCEQVFPIAGRQPCDVVGGERKRLLGHCAVTGASNLPNEAVSKIGHVRPFAHEGALTKGCRC